MDRLRSEQQELRAFIRATQRELRKPMNALTGILRDLVAEGGDHEHVQSARTALHWAQSLARLTVDLLDLSVLDADGLRASAVTFDLRDGVEDLAHAVLPELGTFSAITVDVHPEVPSRLIGHPQRIRQILIACAQHVAQAGTTPSLVLEVARRSERMDDVELMFSVRASVGGVASPPAPRRPPATSPDFGLMLARRLAAAMGGELTASEHGNAFELTLHIEKAAAPAPARVAAPALPAPETTPAPPAPSSVAPAPPAPSGAPPAPTAAAGSLAGTRVLIAGDSGPSRVSISIALRTLGCESDAAQSVAEACEKLVAASRRMRPFHICVADFSIPGDDAAELARRVRESDELRHTQLMLMVEMGASGDAQWAAETGYSAYLVKPVQVVELGAVFTQLLFHGAAAQPGVTGLVTRHTVRVRSRRRLECLVVDDDRVNLLVLKTILERLGHSVEVAENGTDALAAAERRRPDLVLSDVRMPDFDGDVLAARLLERQRERGERPTPIFAMSANSLPGDATRCRSAGVTNYYRKPITLPILTQIVRFAMEDTIQGPGSAPGTPPDAAVPSPVAPVAPGSAQMTEGTPIDLDHLEMACVGAPDLRRIMLATFVHEMDTGLERLTVALLAMDIEDTATHASSLTSLCATIGALECSHLLGEVERRAMGGTLEGLPELHAQVMEEWDRVQAFARTLGETPATGASSGARAAEAG